MLLRFLDFNLVLKARAVGYDGVVFAAFPACIHVAKFKNVIIELSIQCSTQLLNAEQTEFCAYHGCFETSFEVIKIDFLRVAHPKRLHRG